MNDVKTIVNELDAKITQLNSEYVELHKHFDTFRGKVAGEHADEINEVLHNIQVKFQELYPALFFIASRNQYAGNIAEEHHKFLEAILKAGGKFEEKAPIQ